jgi:hypothetical protein
MELKVSDSSDSFFSQRPDTSKYTVDGDRTVLLLFTVVNSLVYLIIGVGFLLFLCSSVNYDGINSIGSIAWLTTSRSIA